MTLHSSQAPLEIQQFQVLLRTRLIALDLGLDDRQVARLVELAALLARWGKRINLSGHRSVGEILDRLIVDALGLGVVVQDLVGAWPSRMVDLGSGAGIPGLPLAIVHPETTVELVEARARRHHFQRAACREISILNAVPRLGRIEQLAPSRAPLVVAQAVGPIRDVTSLAVPWLAAGGWLVVPSGSLPPHFDPGPGWIDHGSRPYSSPGSIVARSIWFGQRSLEAAESP
jgi:16S rRNA (guanine527-N7)-methyltransferase